MSVPPVRLLAEAGPAAGMGHLARCSALARALRFRGIEIETLAVGLEHRAEIDDLVWLPAAEAAVSPDGLTVVDGYGLPERLSGVGKTASMHRRWGDGVDPPVLHLELGAEPAPDALTELSFACLRAPFWALARRPPAALVEEVLVTTGGGDSAARSDQLAADVKEALPAGIRVAAVRGPLSSGSAPPNVELVSTPADLASHLVAADLVLTAAGQTLLESMCAGTPTVAAVLAPDQGPQAAAASAAGGAVLSPPEELAACVVELVADAPRRGRLADAGPAAVDGLGAHRVASRLLRLAGGPADSALPGCSGIWMRPAALSDGEYLLDLRNDQAVRAASRNAHEVGTGEHRAWLEAVLADPLRHLFVLIDGEGAIGQLRLDFEEDGRCELSVSLSAGRRGAGLGREVVRGGALHALSELGAETVEAWVGELNRASEAAFAAAGFELIAARQEGGFRCWTCSLHGLFAGEYQPTS